MIKTLQKKFIITAMAAVSVLLVVFICALNLTNCWLSSQQTDGQLRMLADHDKPKPPERKGSFLKPPMDEDTAMSLRYFTVTLNADDQVVRKDVSRISSVSEAEAEDYALSVVKKNKSIGYLSQFKYRITTSAAKETEDEETTVLFLDVSGQIRSIGMVAALSVGAAILCWLGMLLLVIFLSRRAILPIAHNIRKQRQFVTDAGHEIKTPLAIIQANIDAMELINGENKWSRNIRSQTVRLNGLMQNLLTLAKMDEEALQLPKEDVTFSGLLADSVRSFEEAALCKQIRMETEIAPGIMLRGNRESLQRLLSILLDNAVKYTNDGGIIAVSLQAADKAAVLQVKNTCDKLPQGDAQKLFDRFYRGDSARTQKNGGYGIGLSAASAIVKAHQGHISAKYADGNTIIFTIKL